MTRRTGVLAALLCFVGAAFLYSFDLNSYNPRPLPRELPWFLFFLGLVWLWRALRRTVREAVFLGAALVIAGIGLIAVNPFFVLFGAHWLVGIGFLFPIWISITSRFGRRQPARDAGEGETKT